MEDVNKATQEENGHTNGNSHHNNTNNNGNDTTTHTTTPVKAIVSGDSTPNPQPADPPSQTPASPAQSLPTPIPPSPNSSSIPFSISPSSFSAMNLIPADLVNFTSPSPNPAVTPIPTSPTTTPSSPPTTAPSTTPAPATPASTPATTTPAPATNPPISFEEFLLSFGGQNLSDEEFAVKLQQYYEMTDSQAAANAAAAAVIAANPTPTKVENYYAIHMLDEDEKLAKKLQEQFYSEITKEPKPYSKTNSYHSTSWNQPPPIPPAPTSHAPPPLLTPQTASSFLKNIGATNPSTSTSTTSTTTSTTATTSTTPTTSTSSTTTTTSAEPEKPEEESEIVCLICHDSEFDEYIVLPACEHRYCIDCASRMMSTPPQNPYAPSYGARRPKKGATGDAGRVTCAMCESVTELDPVAGLDGLKRRVKKRKAGDAFSADCAQHGQPLLFYCFDHSEPVCFACIQLSGPHNGHKYDALDSAVAKLKQESANKLITVNEKRQKISEFKTSVEQSKSQIEGNGEKKYVELKEYLAKVRKLLEKKEKDLETEIKRMIDRKSMAAQQEIKWADEKLNLLDKTISGVGALLDENAKKDSAPDACLRFVAGLADCEELLADSVHLPAKQVNNDQYNFPPLTTAFSLTLRAINNLSYTDALQAPGFASYDDGDYSDEEAAEGNEEDMY
eukprot:Phypoly_transcript_02829.p1 GENE.Phypoly_transcript_02829~~Phypoly_transcript_02829.p1  ORF type:complete len:696 (+),score=180.60 Phypoly_transcript_02829:68-2089(+)